MKSHIHSFLAIILLLVIGNPDTFSTNYIAGDISYSHISGNSCYTKFKITVSLYTTIDSTSPSSISVTISDGNKMDVSKTDSIELDNNIVLNKYSFDKIFAGCGTYYITFYDTLSPRWGVNVNASTYGFFLRTEIWTSPFFPNKFSPYILDYKLISVPQNDTSFKYNPVVYNHTDGDSLSFQFGAIDTFPKYWIPAGMTINPVSGEIKWTNIVVQGRYEFTLIIKKYIMGVQSGYVYRNFIIIVDSIKNTSRFQNTQNWPTNSNGYYQYNLKPNDNLFLSFSYSDSLADSIYIMAYSELFNLTNPPLYNTAISNKTANISFDWVPDYSTVRSYPYILCFIGHSIKQTVHSYNYITLIIYVDSISLFIQPDITNSNITISPNPTTGKFQITGNQYPVTNIAIHNPFGQAIFQSSNINLLSHINLTSQPNGIYFLTATINGQPYTIKIIKI